MGGVNFLPDVFLFTVLKTSKFGLNVLFVHLASSELSSLLRLRLVNCDVYSSLPRIGFLAIPWSSFLDGAQGLPEMSEISIKLTSGGIRNVVSREGGVAVSCWASRH